MEDGTAGTCTNCNQPLHSGDRFCPHCGEAVPQVDVVDEQTESTEVLAEQPDPVQKKSRRIVGIVAAVAAIGLVLAGAAWWGLTQNSEAKRQYAASAPVLMASLDDMSGVQSTEMVQEVAGSVQGELTAIDATLNLDPQAPGTDRLTTLQQAFTAIAVLQAYEETNTEVWTDNKPALMSSLRTLSEYGGDTELAVDEGEDAARTLDDLTRQVDKAMAKYRKQVAKAKSQARSERADLRSYDAQTEALIDRYTALRNDTGAFVDRMDHEQMYMYDVSDYFTQAATDRRQVANQLASIRPPTDMRGEHQRIVTVIGDGADAIDAAVAALEDAECFDGECYFEFNTQWQQFQDESSRITIQYGDAYDAWQAAMAKAIRQARGAELPQRPDL